MEKSSVLVDFFSDSSSSSSTSFTSSKGNHSDELKQHKHSGKKVNFSRGESLADFFNESASISSNSKFQQSECHSTFQQSQVNNTNPQTKNLEDWYGEFERKTKERFGKPSTQFMSPSESKFDHSEIDYNKLKEISKSIPQEYSGSTFDDGSMFDDSQISYSEFKQKAKESYDKLKNKLTPKSSSKSSNKTQEKKKNKERSKTTYKTQDDVLTRDPDIDTSKYIDADNKLKQSMKPSKLDANDDNDRPKLRPKTVQKDSDKPNDRTTTSPIKAMNDSFKKMKKANANKSQSFENTSTTNAISDNSSNVEYSPSSCPPQKTMSIESVLSKYY